MEKLRCSFCKKDIEMPPRATMGTWVCRPGCYLMWFMWYFPGLGFGGQR
jgi:hypothetical protein